MPSSTSILVTLEGLVQAERWCDALDALLLACPVLLLPEAWGLALKSDPDLFTQACRSALAQSEASWLQRWCATLDPRERRGQKLRARLGEWRVAYTADLIRAAGLALSARALAPGVVPQVSALQDLCAWVDEAVDPSGLAEALLHRMVDCQAFQPDIPAESVALLALETLWSLLAAPAVLPLERLARLRLWSREWLLGPQRGMCRVVPVVCVETDSAGLAHDTLEVELHTPGSGQTMRWLPDVLAVPDGPAARCLPDMMDEAFCSAIARAFQAACSLAQRTEVDARWRLRRGLHGTPVLAAQGGSASGQALRALYSALTDTWPDPGVLVLAEVGTDTRQLRGVLGVPQKVQAIVQAVQARQGSRSAPASPAQGDPGLCDTLVVASAGNEREALETLQALGATELLRVVWAHTPAEACAVRSQLVEALERAVADGARQFGHTPWYQAATPLRFVHLTLLLDQGPDTPGPRWQVAPQTFADLPAVLTHVAEPALVVLGPPGAGKSTLLRHYDLAVTQAALEARTDLRQAPLTFFVALNDYRPQADGTLPAPRAWLAARWATRYPGLPPLDTFLRERRLTLLLDALNEMPVAHEEAITLWRACIREFRDLFPGTRLVFSCRSLDYSASLSSPACPVPQVRIEPLDDTQVYDFLRRYSPDPAQGEALWAQLADTPQLDLFRSPYYLYLLVQHSPDGQIPSGRAALFTGFLWQTLRREVEQDHPLLRPEMLMARDRQRLIQASHAPEALPEDGLLLPGLSTLAWHMQQRGVATEGSQVRVPYREALACLGQTQAAEILAAGTALAVLEQDLLANTVVFRHQLLQEYFAARRLAQQPDPTLVQQGWRVTDVPEALATTLGQLAPSDPLPPLPSTGWEETTVLAAAMTSQPDAFVAALLETNVPLAGRCVAEPGVQVSEVLKAQVRQALVARTQDPTADLRARIAAGLALGRLGDPRFVRRDGPHGAYLEPPLIMIPGGVYRIGSDEGFYDDEAPVHEVALEAFDMGQFPVTNAEWHCFMEAGGYDDARWWETAEAQAWRRGEEIAGGEKQWWHEWRQERQGQRETLRAYLQQWPQMELAVEFWESFVDDDAVFEETLRGWFPSGRQTQPQFWRDEAFNNPAQPVVGICWFEARAYCAWLSAQTGASFRLPTEVEWEAAARGQHRRRYAYGDALDIAHCNIFDTHIRRTTPVGCFPGGATPEGVQDLTGNIWEWTSSLYEDYPYDTADGREDVHAISARRVLRGGSWYGVPRTARATYRSSSAPDDRANGTGLRLVRVVPFPGSLPTEAAAPHAAAAKIFFAPARRLWHTIRRWLRPAGLPGTGSARAARRFVERRSS